MLKIIKPIAILLLVLISISAVGMSALAYQVIGDENEDVPQTVEFVQHAEHSDFWLVYESQYVDEYGSLVTHRVFVDNLAVAGYFAEGEMFQPFTPSGTTEFRRESSFTFNPNTNSPTVVTVWATGTLTFDNGNPRVARISNQRAGLINPNPSQLSSSRTTALSVENDRGNNLPFTRAFATLTVGYTITNMLGFTQRITVSMRGYSDGQIT